MKTRKRFTRASGTHQTRNPSITIHFDRKMFDQIADIAERNQWSFSGVTRLLVEWGLEDMDGETALLPLFTEGRRKLAAARKGKGFRP